MGPLWVQLHLLASQEGSALGASETQAVRQPCRCFKEVRMVELVLQLLAPEYALVTISERFDEGLRYLLRCQIGKDYLNGFSVDVLQVPLHVVMRVRSIVDQLGP